MAKFRVQTHARLQEWVAEEEGYFADEGLDYEFVPGPTPMRAAGVAPADAAPPEVIDGAFESYERGRECEISSACHWAVGMAASALHGRMWGHAYSVTPSAILVPPESPIRRPADLAGADIAVGYHSGSHFSTLQALEGVLTPAQTSLRFIGRPLDRLAALLDRQVPAGAVFGTPLYVLEQQGFRRILDSTFMIGFLIAPGTDDADVERYFRALRRAQRAIDLTPERWKHYFLRELPAAYHPLADVRGFGLGERIVFEPYTRAMYERTHRWMVDRAIFPPEQVGTAGYELAVLGDARVR